MKSQSYSRQFIDSLTVNQKLKLQECIASSDSVSSFIERITNELTFESKDSNIYVILKDLFTSKELLSIVGLMHTYGNNFVYALRDSITFCPTESVNALKGMSQAHCMGYEETATITLFYSSAIPVINMSRWSLVPATNTEVNDNLLGFILTDSDKQSTYVTVQQLETHVINTLVSLGVPRTNGVLVNLNTPHPILYPIIVHYASDTPKLESEEIQYLFEPTHVRYLKPQLSELMIQSKVSIEDIDLSQYM